jgi:hypothetical protein
VQRNTRPGHSSDQARGTLKIIIHQSASTVLALAALLHSHPSHFSRCCETLLVQLVQHDPLDISRLLIATRTGSSSPQHASNAVHMYKVPAVSANAVPYTKQRAAQHV